MKPIFFLFPEEDFQKIIWWRGDLLHSWHHLEYSVFSFPSLFDAKSVHFSRVHGPCLLIVQISENETSKFVVNGVMLTIVS